MYFIFVRICTFVHLFLNIQISFYLNTVCIICVNKKSKTHCLLYILCWIQRFVLPFLNSVYKDCCNTVFSLCVPLKKKHALDFVYHVNSSIKKSLTRKKNITGREKTSGPSLIHEKCHTHTSEDK